VLGQRLDNIQDIQKHHKTGPNIKKKIEKVNGKGEITVHFNELEPGKYSVFCLHDVNGNETPDFDGKLPLEPYGIYTATEPGFPPDFNDANKDLPDKTSRAEVTVPLLRIKGEGINNLLRFLGKKETEELNEHVKVLMTLNSQCPKAG
jgi:hypothetical protein